MLGVDSSDPGVYGLEPRAGEVASSWTVDMKASSGLEVVLVV